MQIVIPDDIFPKLSNQSLLEISLCLFLAFALAEIVGALYSTSLSLLGDAVCMCVDVTTYVGNAYVEWVKSQYGRISLQMRWVMEVYMPCASVLALVLVTVYITYDASHVLFNPPKVDTVDVDFLYGYSTANLLVDLLCGALFFMRSEDVFAEHDELPRLSLDTSLDEEDREFGYLEDGEAADLDLDVPANTANKNTSSYHSIAPCPTQTHAHRTNLNMLSAFAHILGDTLRTLSMFAAAAVSSLTGLAGDVCDAWAAVLVCVSIVAMCVPILMEIYKASAGLRDEASLGSHTSITSTNTNTSSSHTRTSASAGSSLEMTSYSKLRDRDFDESDGVVG